MNAPTLTRKILFWQLLLALFLPLSAQAAVQKVQVLAVVSHKKIDIAQQMALDYAKKRALFQLASKWNVEDLSAKLSKLPEKTLNRSVRGAEIIRTARQEDILYAEVAVMVQDTVLKRALGVPLNDAALPNTVRGILVIPVRMDGEIPRIWGKENTLIPLLQREALTYGGGAVVLASGNRDDMAELGADNLLSADFAELKAMAARYGGDEILIAVVTPGLPETKNPTEILLKRLMAHDTRAEALSLEPKNATTPEAERLSDAAETIARYAAGLTQAVAELERRNWAKLPQQHVTLQFTTLREYGVMDTVLRESKAVAHMDIPVQQLQRVEAVLSLAAPAQQLREELIRAGVRVDAQGDRWILRMR